MTALDEEFAPAKVNLALHVTGRRGDGYHLLDSLVVFAGVGDRLQAFAGAGGQSGPGMGPELRLSLQGPKAAGLSAGEDNLVLRAARLMAAQAPLGASPPQQALDLVLDKQLPTAAGIGGGSSDAAATLRLLARLWRRALPGTADLLGLGADLPVCLAPGPQRMAGIGEQLSPLPALPRAWLVLANPGLPVSTPAIFRALAQRDNPPLPADLQAPLAGLADARALADWLAGQRNDLQGAAIALAPPIADCLGALAAQPGCLLARMSGSGATCWGLFADQPGAEAAARALARAEPGWWLAAAQILG